MAHRRLIHGACCAAQHQRRRSSGTWLCAPTTPATSPSLPPARAAGWAPEHFLDLLIHILVRRSLHCNTIASNSPHLAPPLLLPLLLRLRLRLCLRICLHPSPLP
jgi:hypothetical protein